MRKFFSYCIVFFLATVSISAGEIHVAVLAGNLSGVAAALRVDPASVNQVDEAAGGTPLILAALLGNIEIASLLLDNGADVNIAVQGVTPLHGAAYKGSADITRLLLAHGADPAAKTPGGLTALEWALERGHDSVAALLDSRAEPDSRIDATEPQPQTVFTEPDPISVAQVETPEPDPANEQIAALMAEIDELTDQLRESEEKRRGLETDFEEKFRKLREDKQTEITELELIIRETEKALDEEREAVLAAAELEKNIVVLERRLKLAEERRTEVENRYKDGISRAESSRDKAVAELNREIAGLKASERALRSDYETSRRESAELKRKLGRLEKNLKASDERYERLKQSHAAALEEARRSRDEAIAGLTEKLEKTRRAESSLRVASAEQEKEIAGLREKISRLEAHLSGVLESDFDQSGHLFETAMLREKINALEYESARFKLEKELLVSRLDALGSEYSGFMSETLREIEAIKTGVLPDALEAERRIEELNRQLAEMNEKVSGSADVIEQAEREKAAFIEERAAMEKKLRLEIAARDEVINGLHEKIQVSEERLSALEQRVSASSAHEPDTGQSMEGSVVDMGSKIVQLAMKMKETIMTDDAHPEFQTAAQDSKTEHAFGAEILYKQNRSDGTITDFTAKVVEAGPSRDTGSEDPRVPETAPPDIALSAGIPPDPEREKAVPGPGAPDDHSDDAFKTFVSVMHVHTSVSSGRYSFPELTEIAAEKNIDVVFLSDSLAESIEYGLFPLRHIFWINKHLPSVVEYGLGQYIAAVERENERQSQVLYIPGVELVPRFYWSGSLLKGTLVCNNHQRNIIALGVTSETFIRNTPIVCGFLKGRDTFFIIATRAVLGLFVLACIAAIAFARPLARRSGYPAMSIFRAFCVGLVVPSILLMVGLNVVVSYLNDYDIYSPDYPSRFEQRVIDALNRQDIPHFWAHPEAVDEHDLSYFGVNFKAQTRAYPEILTETRDYTGFAGVNEGRNDLIEPGSGWDKVLKEYIDGTRRKPVWCFGEMLYHYEGQAGRKTLDNIETVIWAENKDQIALLDAVRQGRFYSRKNFEGRKLSIDHWHVSVTDPVEITLRGSSNDPDEQIDVVIVKDGYIIHESRQESPFEVRLQDQVKGEGKSYYRALIRGRRPVMAVSNPIFVR